MSELADMISRLIICVVLLIPIVLVGIALYLLWKRKWEALITFAIILTVLLLAFGVIVTSIAKQMYRSPPKLTPSEFAGRWVGSFPFADSKPTLPTGIVHEFVLNEDGTCYVRGFLQLGSPVRVYGGDGKWRIEEDRWHIVITQMLDGVQHEDRLWIIWTVVDRKRQWLLNWPWFDPDSDAPKRNDLQFTKVTSGE